MDGWVDGWMQASMCHCLASLVTLPKAMTFVFKRGVFKLFLHEVRFFFCFCFGLLFFFF